MPTKTTSDPVVVLELFFNNTMYVLFKIQQVPSDECTQKF